MPFFSEKPGFKRTALSYSVPFALLACTLVWAFLNEENVYRELIRIEPEVARVFQKAGLDAVVGAFGYFSLLCAFVAAFGAMASWVRKEWSLAAIRKSLFAFYLPAFFLCLIVLKGTYLMNENDVRYEFELADPVNVFYWRWAWTWPLGLVVLFAGFMHVTAWRRRVINIYDHVGADEREKEDGPAWGDRLLENWRNHGDNPDNRRSMIRSVLLHIFVLIILPWLLSLLGGVTPYLVPKGRGEPVVTQVRVVKKKIKKQKKMIVNPDSPFAFNFPEIDKLMKEVEEETRQTYVANNQRNAKGGKMGAGGKGPGGWPDGMANGLVRFIRLEYRGAGWEDGMDASRADINFLQEFRKLTGFPVANAGEAHGMSLLKKYPKGYAPPFIYMTGSGGISTSSGERAALREYLLGGGLLFADCGGSSWNGSFKNFIGSVVPEYRLIDIADDDPIFQEPFGFPNGAPPLWHHGGNRAMGIKHGDRWMVFYHPGDLNDAWKTGASGLDVDKAEASYEMGINVLYYAFTRYLELTRKYRK